jgi:hypothetical protein
VILAIQLLHNKYLAESFWKPYLDVRPESLDALPYWAEEELKEIEESPVFHKANSIISSRKEAYSTYSNSLFKVTLEHHININILTVKEISRIISILCVHPGSI